MKPTWIVIIRYPNGSTRALDLSSVPVVRNEVRRYRRRGYSVAVINADAALEAGVDEFAAWDEENKKLRGKK